LENRDDGTFRLIGLPGRSLVVARAWSDRYLVGVGAENLKGRDQNGFLDTRPHLCHPTHFHTLVELNPDKQAGPVVCNVLLDPGRTLTGTLLGWDGKPLAGVRASGLKSYAYTYWDYEPLKTAEFKVFALKPGQPRRLLFLHEGKRLAGTILVRGDEKDPPRVKLEPWGSLTGRIVNADGQPQSNVEIMSVGIPSSDSDDASLHNRSIRPDKDGKFRIEGLVPGLKYRIGIMAPGFRLAGYLGGGMLTVKSGENKDLGDVQAKPIE